MDIFLCFSSELPQNINGKVRIIYYIIVKTKGTDLEKPKIAISQHWIYRDINYMIQKAFSSVQWGLYSAVDVIIVWPLWIFL